MSATLACPAVRDLQKLVRGELPAHEAGPMRQHLRACTRCLEISTIFEAENAAPSSEASSKVEGVKKEGPSTWAGGVRPKTDPLPPEPPPAAAARAPNVPASGSVHDLLMQFRPPQAPDEIGRLASYRLLRTLGSGATGVVFLAEDVNLRRQVALKVMKNLPEDNDIARQRFLREAQAAAVLDHDNIISIYQVGEDCGVPFLAMKLLQGETLDDRLKREKQLLVHEVLRIGREIAEGLAAAHERGLIHRDVKPANIFLEAGNGRVKIVDFGLARSATEDQHLTRTGTIVGTPAYMSPEQARGVRLDHRSDLFSLGCVLYRMLTGETPFKADDTMGMLIALSQDQPAPVRAFCPMAPPFLVGLVAQLLAKLPEGRPASARAVADLLERIERQVATVAHDNKLGKAARARRSVVRTLVQLGLLVGLGWAVYWFGPDALRIAQTETAPLTKQVSKMFGKR